MPEKPLRNEIVLEMTPEELAEWKQREETRKVFKFLRLIREDLKESLGAGEFLDLCSAEKTALASARVAGELYGLDHLLLIQAPEPEPDKAA